MPFGAKVYLARARGRHKAAHTGTGTDADVFVVEAYNPEAAAVTATLSLRPPPPADTAFQHMLEFAPGYNRLLVPRNAIAARIDLAKPFLVQIEPHETEREVTLYFGLLDFAHLTATATPPGPRLAAVEPGSTAPLKCVVWDLDNTMWQGTLLEDGVEGLRLREDAVQLVRELDRRGVINSIASKNHPSDALVALARFGIAEYFLCAQVSWGPKSAAITEIARRLNIGVDSLAFIDDQPFELAEVAAAHPKVVTVPAESMGVLLAHPRLDLPVTAESQRRRSLYQVELARDAAEEQAGGDYLAFLRSCGLELRIRPLAEGTVTRVYELAQRTNQMNFSGNRYPQAAIAAMVGDPEVDALVLSARDRFGDYGIIGFAVIDHATATLRDLMMSCRIQAKHVDRAFLVFALERYSSEGRHLTVLYRQTERNRVAAQLFWDFGFTGEPPAEGVHTLVYDGARLGSPKQDVVRVVAE